MLAQGNVRLPGSQHCRRAAAAWLIATALLLGAVKAGAQASSPIRFGLSSPVVTLDPRFATDATSSRINRLLYRALTDFDENFSPVPSLADWEQLSPTRYRFTLRARRATFTDGTPLTATDVKATYDSVLDASQASPHRGSLMLIETILRIDEDTVEFALKRPDPLFPGKLSIGILPAAQLASGRAFSRAPMGSGAFELLRFEDENNLVIRRRADGLEVKFTRVPEPTVRVLKLARGEIDIIQGDLPPELVTWLSARDEIALKVRRGTNVAYLGFNLEDPATSDLRVRQAVAHAIDRGAIVEHLLGGRAREASSLLVPQHWAGHAALRPIDFDQDEARRLLREAGYGPARRLVLTYKTSSDPFRLRLGTVLQHQLAAVGIEVNLKSYDWGTFYADIKAGRFQMYSLAWIGIKDPDIFRYTMHSDAIPPGGANRGRFSSPRIDQLIEKAESGVTRGEQAAAYRRLQAELLQALPVFPLWFEDQMVLHRGKLPDYRLSPDGNYDALATMRLPGGT